MSGYRLSKYDPMLRRPDGSFAGDEWTSVSDIGKKFSAGVLTREQYASMEDAYVDSIRRFRALAGVTSLSLVGLEPRPGALSSELSDGERLLKDGATLSGEELDKVIRLCLRELAWCRLESKNGFYVHFGYDYYVYVGNRAADLAIPQLPRGMYAEPLERPYDSDELNENE